MIAIIKDIYQELSNRKRISIIDVFVSLLVIRITDHFVNINTYFSKIFNNKIISSIIPILTGILHCLNILIIIVFIICILSLISYSVLNAISSRTHYDLLRFIYDMHYTSTHSIDFMTTLFFYMISIGLFLELASKFDIQRLMEIYEHKLWQIYPHNRRLPHRNSSENFQGAVWQGLHLQGRIQGQILHPLWKLLDRKPAYWRQMPRMRTRGYRGKGRGILL